MASDTLYAVRTTDDRIGLFDAPNAAKARREALRSHGRDNIRSVRRATPEDIAWVRGMGGYVPGDKS